MKTEAPLVYVIILNWNRPQETLKCVGSVLLSSYPNYRVLVVDNGSTDNSLEMFGLLGEAVEVISNEQNLGFAAGMNVGIEYALAQGADYTLLLNNDTSVDAEMLNKLVDAAKADPAVGLAGPTIYYESVPDKVWFLGMKLRPNVYVIRTGLEQHPKADDVQEVDFVSGCAMLAKREVWEQVGMFDPAYFMYYEDLDLCLRAQQQGFKIISVLPAVMWHSVSASSGGPSSLMKQYHQVKSSIRFYKRHTRGLYFWLNMSLRLAHAGWTTLHYALTGQLELDTIRSYLIGISEEIKGSTR